MVIWEPSGAVRNPPPPFPGEFTLDDEPVDAQKNKIIAVDEVAPRTADGEPSHDASDLLPGTRQDASDAESRRVKTRQTRQDASRRRVKTRWTCCRERLAQKNLFPFHDNNNLTQR